MTLTNRPILFADFKKNRDASLKHIKDICEDNSEYAVSAVTVTIGDIQNNLDQITEEDVADICEAMVTYPPVVQSFLLTYFTTGRSVTQDEIQTLFKEFIERNPSLRKAMESSIGEN